MTTEPSGKAGINNLDEKYGIRSDGTVYPLAPSVPLSDEVNHARAQALGFDSVNDALDALKDPGHRIIDMWLCEATKVALHIGELYRFRPAADCEECQRLKREHDEAYGYSADRK